MENIELTHGGLFAGIGGFEEGAELAGIQNIWNCELIKKNRDILKKHYPNTEQYEDIRTMQEFRPVDIISGGFPCQDISTAGGGAGIAGEQSGLWSEMFRIFRIGRPKYGIIENSPMLTIRGLERVLCDLSQIGYHAEWQCISNQAFGFPHKRERIYIIAYTNEIGSQRMLQEQGSFSSIFKQWTPNKAYGHSCAKRLYAIADHSDIRVGDGLQGWAYRVGGVGNSVNPILARYLFSCIKDHYLTTLNS